MANAVFEQADALMLSGETTIGRYPIECVRSLAPRGDAYRAQRRGGLCRECPAGKCSAENGGFGRRPGGLAARFKTGRFYAAGRMARYASNLRPQRAPIFAFTPSEEVYRQLALYWGTFPACIDFAAGSDRTISAAEKFLRKNKWGYTWRPHGNCQ